MFYFSYQLRIQLIPYILQQILLFSEHCKHINPQHHSYQKTLSLALKRRKDLENFYYQHYEDFRSPLIVDIIHHLRIIICTLNHNSQKNHKTNYQKPIKSHDQEQKQQKSKSKIKTEESKQKKKLSLSLQSKQINLAKSIAALKVTNKKIESTMQKTLQSRKNSGNISKTSSMIKLQTLRKGSEEASVKMGLGSTKQLQPPGNFKSKPMSKSQFMSYLQSKQNANK